MPHYFKLIGCVLAVSFVPTIASSQRATPKRPAERAYTSPQKRRAALPEKDISARPLEFPDDAPAPASLLKQRKVAPARVWLRGPFASVQVNIDAFGNNIIGDAANEPSIAVDPTNRSNIVIGWRQFDTIASNFRQAGHAYSHDGGQSWTFPGVLEPGQFRSDPVLAADADGNFYFYSLSALDSAELFKSTDGGVNWTGPVPGFGGDKEWMTVDRTSGMGRGNIYGIWNVQFSCCGDTDFTRSTNGGASFEPSIAMPDPRMKWGTLDVAADGRLYLAGATLDQTSHVVARSSDAQDPSQTPSFDFAKNVYLGGTTTFGGPNPAGLVGQVWIATDHSTGPTGGNLYILGSVAPPGPDPLDVMFIRSTDGGLTWSAPVRVNDDPTGNGAYQWFGTMSVAPNGRIDVVWNDTRNTGAVNLSELYYTFSIDGGASWSASTAVSPVFDSHIGWPQQNKLGDYYHMISDNGGADLAYAATFNGEQDVYFLRIPADCNGNGIEDPIDIANGVADDCNGNDIPDSCEPDADCNHNSRQDVCDIASGTSDDCNRNRIPDECEPDEDCNMNGTRDICEIGSGASSDCNDNSVPDECDITFGTSLDDNNDGIPDECQGACCLCGGCIDTTFTECAALLGDFTGTGVLCADVGCSAMQNDDCVNAELLPQVGDLTVPYDNICATTDGPVFVSCDNGSQPFGADLWYQYIPACSGNMTISLCDNTNYDAILAVYGGGPTCQCPFEGAGQLACSDDSCGIGGGPPIVTIPVQQDACYTIRVAGWNGSAGVGEMRISLPCCPTSDPPQPDRLALPGDPVSVKNRFLSVRAGEPGRNQAIRVTFVNLPSPFDTWNGLQFFAGAPTQICENAGQGSDTAVTDCAVAPGLPHKWYWDAPLVCNEADAHFMDWHGVCAGGTCVGGLKPGETCSIDDDCSEVVHMFHEGVVPNGVYDIQIIDSACPMQNQSSYSVPLTMTQAGWGDVVLDCTTNPCGPPNGIVDVANDVTSILDKFKNLLGAPIKARCDLAGIPPSDGLLDRKVDILDVTWCLQGFTGGGYPFPPGVDPCQ